jgi:hypothetical protein
MSQADIDAFVTSAHSGLTFEAVMKAIATDFPMNGRRSKDGYTALQFAAYFDNEMLVVALLAAGADPDVKDHDGWTAVMWAAAWSNPTILQLLIDAGGSVNATTKLGQTPLIAVIDYNGNPANTRDALLARPELELNERFEGKMAEERAAFKNQTEFVAAIADARAKQRRWAHIRTAWVGATAA